ncbi:hypothetical protein FOZ60_017374 [Perkinsus olseni]|uniref:Uncharacterized protein n=1 Tax=Perkinsus olseni TaxID=32597 RepID=A0A7J6P3T1_PEROL|nr:hypothetical protein FOZ60_017374 [Perkinsus olseni]
MPTFIIWIASVICLMIHIPQVYGATPFNSDNNEDPMEVDAHGSRKNVRARRSRREFQPTTAHAANGKRKWEMQNLDLPQAKKLMQSKGAEEYSTSPRVAVRMFTDHARVRYSVEIEKQTGIISRVVGVSCGESVTFMTTAHGVFSPSLGAWRPNQELSA